MQPETYTRTVLTIIALLLAIIALRPALTVQAQSESPWLYVEPRTTTLRTPDGTGQMQGKVSIDLRTSALSS